MFVLSSNLLWGVACDCDKRVFDEVGRGEVQTNLKRRSWPQGLKLEVESGVGKKKKKKAKGLCNSEAKKKKVVKRRQG